MNKTIMFEMRAKNNVIATLASYKEAMRDALIPRFAACTRMRDEKANQVVYSDEYVIVYQDGTHFSWPAYEAMRNCIEAIEQGQWEAFFGQPMWANQLCKAFMCASFGAPKVLADVLMELQIPDMPTLN